MIRKTGNSTYSTAILTLLALTAVSLWAQSGNQQMQQRITKEVRHELVMLPQLTIFDNLAFKVDGGNVTLLGQVRNAVLKDEAQSAIKNIEGVEKINNQIEILPPSPDDDRIRMRVARAIFSDDGLFRYS